MSSIEILDYEHQQIILEDQTHRLAAERRHAVPGCGYDCEDGWHEIVLGEFGPPDDVPENDPAVIVLPWGLILFACECNSGPGGRVRNYPPWHDSKLFPKKGRKRDE